MSNNKIKFKNNNINDRPPNWRDKNGNLYVIKCFKCGKENHGAAVSSGICAYCGYNGEEDE